MRIEEGRLLLIARSEVAGRSPAIPARSRIGRGRFTRAELLDQPRDIRIGPREHFARPGAPFQSQIVRHMRNLQHHAAIRSCDHATQGSMPGACCGNGSSVALLRGKANPVPRIARLEEFAPRVRFIASNRCQQDDAASDWFARPCRNCKTIGKGKLGRGDWRRLGESSLRSA